jgi:PIN domain nuclease of toxin-antitoxin system
VAADERRRRRRLDRGPVKVLTDTHTLVWALSNPEALGPDARAALAGLPDLHKDPFDRILVQQSLAEGLTLVSEDAILALYGVPVIW